MNQKINATKNNSFKKAFIMIALAASSACAFFVASSNSVLRNNFSLTTVSAKYNSFFDDYDDDFDGWNSFDDYKNKRFSDNQRVNVRFFENNFQRIRDVVNKHLDPNAIYNSLPNKNDNNISESDVRKTLDSIQDSEEFQKFSEVVQNYRNYFNNNSRYSNDGDYLDNLISAMLNFQNYILKSLVDLRTVLNLPQMKNPEKLKNVEKINNDISRLSKLLSVAGLDDIKKDASKTQEAVDMVNSAITCFYSGNMLGNMSKKSKNDWDQQLERVSFFKNYSRGLNGLYSLVHVLLYYNSKINYVFENIVTLRVLRNLAQAMQAIIAKTNDPVMMAVTLSNPEGLLRGLASKYPDLLVMILSLIDIKDQKKSDVFLDKANNLNSQGDTSDESSVENAKNCLRNINENCAKYLSDAMFKTYNVNDIIRALNSIAEKNRNNVSVLFQNGFNFTQALVDTSVDINSVTKYLLYIDGLCLNKINNGNVLDRLAKSNQDKYGMGLEKANEDIRNQLKNQANAAKNLINNLQNKKGVFVVNGSIQPCPYNFNFSLVSNFASVVLATPKTLRLRAFMHKIKNDASYLRASDFNDNSDAFMRSSDYSTVLNYAVNDFNKIYSQANDLIKKLGEIKKAPIEKSKAKERAETCKFSSSCNQILPLTGGNQVNENIKVSSEGKVLHVSGIASDISTVNVTWCPKNNPGDDTTKNHVQIPNIPVRNGVASVDISACGDAACAGEFHFRTIRPENKDEFLFKIYAEVNGNRVKHVSTAAVNASIISDGKLTRQNDPIVYINDDKSLTVIIYGDSGKVMAKPVVLCFPDGEPANFEKDLLAFDYDAENNRYIGTTRPLKSGAKYQIHVYDGKVEAPYYQGKVYADTSKIAVVEEKEKSGSLLSYVSKPGVNTTSVYDSGNETTLTEKRFKLILPSQLFEDNYASHKVNIYLANDSGDKEPTEKFVRPYTIDLGSGTRSGSDERVYSVVVKVPNEMKENSNVRIYIDGLSGLSDEYGGVKFLKSNKNVNDKTPDGEEFKFDLKGDDNYKGGWNNRGWGNSFKKKRNSFWNNSFWS